MKPTFLKTVAVFATALATILGGCSRTGGTGNPEIVFFYVEDCNHCDRMKEVLNGLLAENSGLEVAFYEMESNQRLLRRLAQQHSLGAAFDVPVVFINDRAIAGEGRSQELALRDAVEACATSACRSPLN